MTASTTTQQFFESKYQQVSDPWDFAGDAYEQGRYSAILRALGHGRYQRAFEPGCSVGVLTAGLARLCNEVVAMDIAPTAVEQARQRCSNFRNVSLSCGSLPQAMPGGQFDLIVFSEIGYYFDRETLQALASTLVEHLSTGGTLLAAHWLGTSEDHILSGDSVHEMLADASGLQHQHAERHVGFRLDRWTKPEASTKNGGRA